MEKPDVKSPLSLPVLFLVGVVELIRLGMVIAIGYTIAHFIVKYW